MRPGDATARPGLSPAHVALLPVVLAALSIVASGLAMAFAGEAHGRRLLVLHATLATVLLPLALAGAACAADWARSAAHRSIGLSAATTIAGVLVVAVALASPGRPLLTTFLPGIGDPAFTALQVGLAGAGFAGLAALALPSRTRSDALRGLAWTALPLGVALVSLAWSWTATDGHAGHVRAELATWAAGHAAPFVATSLLAWAWTGLAEFDARTRHRWCAAAALPSLAILVAQGALAVDDERALRAFPEIVRWGLWPVPLLLAVAILRDDIRRSVAGPAFAASLSLVAIAVLAGIASAFEAAAPAALRVGQHALPLALLVAATAGIRRAQAVASPHPRPDRSRRLAAVGAAASAVLASALIVLAAGPTLRPVPPGPLPAGETPRGHVAAKRAQEIATRFAQGVEMMRLRQYDFAAKAFHRVLELDPAMPEAHVNMGFALLETGDAAGAQRFFESATRLRRDQLNAYYGLALAAEAQGNAEVAVGAMRTWLHLAPQDDPFRGKAQARYERMSQAFAAQRRARGDGPVPPERPS